METDAPGVLFNMDAEHCRTALTKLCLAHRRHAVKCVEGAFLAAEGLGRWRAMQG